jgi:hypothetical protein
MFRTFSQKFRLWFRAVVLFVVFAGLLFSCGEGIRLCPFAFTEAQQTASSNLQNDEERDYEKNLHRFENSCANSQSKSQRFNLPFNWISALNEFDRDAFFKFLAGHKGGFSLNSQIFKSRPTPARSDSRAPPVS